MLVPHCDRCQTAHVQVVSVLGIDLCNSCVLAFREWSKQATVGEQAGYGQRWQQALRVIDLHGFVTSTLLSDVAGIHRTKANWYLHSRAKQGALVFQGNGRFVLPAEAAE